MTEHEVCQLYAEAQKQLLTLHYSADMTWTHMAAESGISAATIKRFATNETTRPQFRTVALLSDYAGFRMEIRHISNLRGKVLPLKRARLLEPPHVQIHTGEVDPHATIQN